MTLTDQILELAFRDLKSLPQKSQRLGRLSFFDWLVCGIGGRDEPVARKVTQFVAMSGAPTQATIFGGGGVQSASAALVNGTISHALDYDDTHFAHIGHLSVAIYPAALAVGEEMDATQAAVVDAFVVGAESAIRIGLALGNDHYERGFHQTATSGAFGATVAAARLYGASSDQLRAALGLCATRASGLKCQFGTMGKPLNAGFAASNGVECVRLAMLGVTSADDGVGGPQGFIETHADRPGTIISSEGFLFDDIRYKLYACCHGTHAMIDALSALTKEVDVAPTEVVSLEISVNPRWLKVCDIKYPRTGLEVKFSYCWLAGMVLYDISCADPAAFTTERAVDPALAAFAQKVSVTGDVALADSEAVVTIILADGTKHSCARDLMAEVDISDLEGRLRQKAHAVIGDRSSAIWELIENGMNDSARSIARFM